MLISAAKLIQLLPSTGTFGFFSSGFFPLFFILSLLSDLPCGQHGGGAAGQRPARGHWLHGNTTCERLLHGQGVFSRHRAAKPNTTRQDEPQLVEMHVHHVPGKGYLGQKTVPLLQQIITRPLDTVSILEPRHRGACNSHRHGMKRLVPVRETASQDECLLAINAGFFNTLTGACLGNIVSDGILVQSSGGIQNAHFGLTKDGYIFTGYPSKTDIETLNFTQLVGGVIWLVRDGINNVDHSIQSECPITQETGTMRTFASARSGRSALGHDAEGRVHFLAVDGKTFKYGVSLYSFADSLIELGIVNAINLDGGGSVTVLANGDLVNRPSDRCKDDFLKCERDVSTAVRYSYLDELHVTCSPAKTDAAFVRIELHVTCSPPKTDAAFLRTELHVMCLPAKTDAAFLKIELHICHVFTNQDRRCNSSGLSYMSRVHQPRQTLHSSGLGYMSRVHQPRQTMHSSRFSYMSRVHHPRQTLHSSGLGYMSRVHQPRQTLHSSRFSYMSRVPHPRQTLNSSELSYMSRVHQPRQTLHSSGLSYMSRVHQPRQTLHSSGLSYMSRVHQPRQTLHSSGLS
ncbi:hypothetical protein RRG08_022481 [Elysia crispata]|uniref:Phosphodiester glycosidase domain-containing protein n=1 Tax=Elysia crispata TaxID=231223 RepID=A0AAE0Z1K8_9GAST|nr:hypothetical protein RRG08_022481 [Elysia crispata]